MTYRESQEYIANNLTVGSVYGLSRIKELLKRLSDPQKDMGIIHIAGTNGKGSVSRMIMSILKESGYRVGIFNSPFLTKRNEYLCINGKDANDAEYAFIAGIVKNAIEGSKIGLEPMEQAPTEFEFSFAMAMEYFSRSGCDIAIVECGLGGKDDATNIFTEKLLSIITNIGIDHVKLLGNTLKDIAKQKSGIILENDTVISYRSEPEALKVIKKTCEKKNSRLITPDYSSFGKLALYDPGFNENDFKYFKLEKDNIWLKMPGIIDSIALDGEFQKKNGMVALSAVAALKGMGYRINSKAIFKGFENVSWPGRFETLSFDPLVIADGGHNVQCAQALCDSLSEKSIKKAVFIIGIMADKDYNEVFRLLKPFAAYVISTEPENSRRLDADIIKEIFIGYGIPSESVKDPESAVKRALTLLKDDRFKGLPVIITGSLYMMGEIRNVFIGGRDEEISN